MIEDSSKLRRCLKCDKKQIVQVREAFFSCLNCNQEYISTVEDMLDG